MITFEQAKTEGAVLFLYYRALEVPKEKALFLASEYVMRRFLFRQDEILDKVVKP